jgi:hypothetical protein
MGPAVKSTGGWARGALARMSDAAGGLERQGQGAEGDASPARRDSGA